MGPSGAEIEARAWRKCEKSGHVLSEIAQKLHVRPAREKCIAMADVLVVDDDPSIRALLRLIVRRAGFECDVACDGKEALELLAANGYKLAIMDLMMPRVNGFEVLERLQDFTRRPAIIVATALHGAYLRELDGRIVHSIVRKPFDLDLMTALINAFVKAMPGAGDPNDDTLRLASDTTAEIMDAEEGLDGDL
jgi:DNA-binding response OmpR family regulator